MPTATEALAGFVAGLRFEDLPPEAVAAAKRHALDTIGVALAASALGTGAQASEVVRAWEGPGEATVFGAGVRVPAAAAALANGTLAHGLDYDDTHIESVVHPSAVIVPAALAVAEAAGGTGRDVVRAAVAGYEVATRIGAAAPGRFHARGSHPTGICGPFGAAATAAAIWRLPAPQIVHAFGVAGSTSAGLFAYVADGSETKRLHAGWAAHAGIVAADLARRGFTGPATVLEGPSGLFDAFLSGEQADLGRITRGLGREWETARIAIKPYPCCHFLHAFIDMARRAGVVNDEITDVECLIAPPAVGIVCEPREARLRPRTQYGAQFSLPFSVASALVGGRDELELFSDEARADERVLALARRVRHSEDPTLPFPGSYGGRMRVRTKDGGTIELEEIPNRGHPDRPLSDDEVHGKLFRNAGRLIERGAAEKLLDLVWRLEELDSVAEIAALCRAPERLVRSPLR